MHLPEDQHQDGHSWVAEGEVVLDRRAALRAALAGSAAAAAFLAPRVEGFTVVPDYAAAASCIPATKVISKGTNGIACLGNGNAGNCGCASSASTQLTNNNVGTVLFATATWCGSMNNTNSDPSGTTKVDVNGITNNKNQTCTVKSNSINQNGACDGWDTATYNMVKVNNTGLSNLTKTWTTACNFRILNMTFYTTITCTCA